ncbi:MAG: aminotransferase class V-fold PLP-dependent enzyme [Gaiellaceae bacterium]|jgi:L-cysteine/cystine lyase
MDFAQARAQFPVLERLAYLNAGTFGPLARATVEAMGERQRRDLELGRSGPQFFDEISALRDEVRARIATLVGAEPAQVALTCSTTDGCNIVLAGLGLSPRDEVVTTSDEHFGLLGPLHASGARIVVAAPEPEAILAAVTPQTKLLALSQVLWTDGRVLPVAEMRERSGLTVLVDGAQSVGAIPVAAAGVDFLTVSAQKWLCGPDTVGALVIREPEKLRVAQPTYFAQKSFDPDGSFEPRPGAARFDSQWIAPASFAGLLASLDGRPEWAFARAAEMSELCRSALAERFEVVSALAQGTLVSWRAGGDPRATVERLYKRGIVVRDIPGRNLIRASCGWWTSEEDIARLLAALTP